MSHHHHGNGPPAVDQAREPIFNLPRVVTVLAALLVVLHLARPFLFGASGETGFLLLFAFIPARYGALAAELPLQAAALWTPLTYAFFHANWAHLVVNLLWMVAFGSPLASRIGTARFLLMSLLAALGGALAHLLTHLGEIAPVIGASGVVSGYMGAAARFAFQPGPSFGLNVHGPALPLAQTFTNGRFLAFAAVWLAINIIFGTGSLATQLADAPIAWQAHIGGFLAGILTFSFVDRQAP